MVNIDIIAVFEQEFHNVNMARLVLLYAIKI